MHVAPIRPGASPTLRVRWAAPLVTRSGVAQLRIPARGNDLRAVVARVSFDAGELLGPTLQGGSNASAVEVEPWSTIELAARLPSHAVRTHAHLFPCGARRCVHAALETGPRTGPSEHVALLVDVSPSTFGPARGRIAPVLTALLAALPPRSDVRAFAFAAQAEALLDTPTPPTEVPFAALASSTQRSLGGATRLDVALNALGDLRDTHVIVLGDGGLTEGPHLRDALAAAERRGARLSVVSLTARAPHPLLSEAVTQLGGRVVLLDDDAFVAHGDLDGRVAPLFAPSLGRASVGRVALGELRAGESLRHVGLAGRRDVVRLGRLSVAARAPRDAELVDALAALGRQHVGGPTRLALAPSAGTTCETLVSAGPNETSRTTPWMLADVRSCALPTAPPPTPDDLGRGIPAETVLSMLRRRVVPVARGCFRRDRAGRENYATRAVFELRLADREVTSADVIGEIDDALRECLLTSVDGLDVPAYAGTIVVRYPLYTQASGPALTIELHPDVAQVVDRVLPEEAP
ncbi:MAG: VWA domain-containing protein [Sandaracinus sp.]|nr:VWA domain-containing protein [Sandaracinus sp.]